MGKEMNAPVWYMEKNVYTKFLLKVYWERDNTILHDQILKDPF